MNELKMEAHIKGCLDIIERDKQVKVLYAAEAGSRAWGFESHDSDYDVRFVYLPIPALRHYLKLDKQRDVIEMKWAEIRRGPESLGEVDAVGWDLRKTFNLFRKANPNFLEWLNSPIHYANDTHNGISLYAQLMRCIVPNIIEKDAPPAPRLISKQAMLFHCWKMARNNYREYLRGDTVWTKKYLYVIRPLLVCTYIEEHDTPPPVIFGVLLEACKPLLTDGRFPKTIGEELIHDIEALVERKMAGAELDSGPRIESLHNFITTELHRFKIVVQSTSPMGQHEFYALRDYLENLFYDFVKET